MTEPHAMNDLRDRVALVTGAGRGIGRAIALLLAEAGATVIVNYQDRRDDALATVAEITEMGQRAIAIGADVSKSTAVDTMMHQIHQHLGRVDILVNHGSVAGIREFADLSDAAFDDATAVNLKAAFLCMQAVLPGMRKRQWGRIVNISTAAMRATRGAAGQLAAGHDDAAHKGGIEELTRAYAAQLVKDGIAVNAVAPSPLNAGNAGNLGGDLAKRVPLARLGTPLEVAQAVVMVLGNAYLTGQVIYAFGASPPQGAAASPAMGSLHIN